jgi:hypothetical protein
MTGSRGGFVTLIPTAAYIIFTIFSGQISLKKKLLIFPIVAGAIYTVFQYAPTQPLMRIIGTLEHLATRNVSGRWDIWQAGLAAWNSSDFSILFGLGVGGYSSSVGRASSFLSNIIEPPGCCTKKRTRQINRLRVVFCNSAVCLVYWCISFELGV